MADLFQQILEVFDRLGLWEDGVELIGSWSFLLYQRHYGVPPYPLRTQDVDFLVPRIYPRRHPVDLAGALAALNFCIHKLIIAQRRPKPEKAAKDIEQAVHLFSVLNPEEFRSQVEKLPKKWQRLIYKSLAKAQQMIPSESANLKKFHLTPQ